MMAIGFAFLAIGLADALAGGLAGQPKSRLRALLGMCGGVFVMLVFLSLAMRSRAAWGFSIGVSLGLAIWLALRMEAQPSERRSGLAAGFFAAFVLAIVFFSPSFETMAPFGLSRLLERHPLPALRAISAEGVIAIGGILALLAAPTNALVRATLRASGTQFETSAGGLRLRGGRLIGMLERWLIFGFAAIGEPTAAALVVSAKSIVRFPEISAAHAAVESQQPSEGGTREIDYITEYFLLGSMVSWIAALIPAAFIAQRMS